jgi:hypothetical protein
VHKDWFKSASDIEKILHFVHLNGGNVTAAFNKLALTAPWSLPGFGYQHGVGVAGTSSEKSPAAAAVSGGAEPWQELCSWAWAQAYAG